MVPTIQPPDMKSPTQLRAENGHSIFTVWTSTRTAKNLIPSDASGAADCKKVESNMPDFEIHTGGLAPNTNDQGAIARGKFVEGTV